MWTRQFPFFFRIDFLFTSTSSEVIQILSQSLMLWFNWFLNSNHFKTCNKKWKIKENQNMKLLMPKTCWIQWIIKAIIKGRAANSQWWPKKDSVFFPPFLFPTSNIFSLKKFFRDKDLFVFSLPSWSHRCVAETKNNVSQLAL